MYIIECKGGVEFRKPRKEKAIDVIRRLVKERALLPACESSSACSKLTQIEQKKEGR